MVKVKIKVNMWIKNITIYKIYFMLKKYVEVIRRTPVS